MSLIFGEVNWYFEEINGNKYLSLVPTNESNKKIWRKRETNKYEELWIKIRDLIRSITKKLDDYDEKCMKIKFDSDENLPLNKTIYIPIVTRVSRVVFHENNIYHPQIFLDRCLNWRFRRNRC